APAPAGEVRRRRAGPAGVSDHPREEDSRLVAPVQHDVPARREPARAGPVRRVRTAAAGRVRGAQGPGDGPTGPGPGPVRRGRGRGGGAGGGAGSGGRGGPVGGRGGEIRAGAADGGQMSDAPPPADGLFPVVYHELRRLAAAKLAAEPVGHTLDATAL